MTQHNTIQYSTGGLKWARDNIKNFHVNTCTYYAKGTADYVGVWDYDEFFQPRGANKNILDIIESVDFSASERKTLEIDGAMHWSVNETKKIIEEGWTPRKGMADGHAHPLCYIIFNSEVSLIAEKNKYGSDPLLVRYKVKEFDFRVVIINVCADVM